MENYDVNIKIEKTIFVEDAKNKEEAIQKAVIRFQEILVPGIRQHSKITVSKSEGEKEVQGQLLEEQVVEVDKIFNDLTNVYNKAELELLAQNLLRFLEN